MVPSGVGGGLGGVGGWGVGCGGVGLGGLGGASCHLPDPYNVTSNRKNGKGGNRDCEKRR